MTVREPRAAHTSQCSARHRLQGNHHMSVKIPGPLYKFNASSLKDRLVSLDMNMKVKIEFVSMCIFSRLMESKDDSAQLGGGERE